MSRALASSVVVAAGAALSGWEGTLGRDSSAAHLSVLVTIALGFGLAAAAGRGRRLEPSLAWARGPFALRRHLAEDRAGTLGALVWTLLVLALIGWDLNSFVHQSHSVPTLSTIFGHLSAHEAGRAALFAGWLLLGGTLALGWRRR